MLFAIYPKIPNISVIMWMVRKFWLHRPENVRNKRNDLKSSPQFPTLSVLEAVIWVVTQCYVGKHCVTAQTNWRVSGINKIRHLLLVTLTPKPYFDQKETKQTNKTIFFLICYSLMFFPDPCELSVRESCHTCSAPSQGLIFRFRPSWSRPWYP